MRDLDALSSDFGRLFLRMHRLMDRRMTENGASLARTKMLMYLEREGPGRAADIAGFFGLAPRTVTEAIDGLERDGLVRRDPDPDDRRVKRVSLLPEGRAALGATEPLRLQLLNQIFGVLEAADREDLASVIAKLSAAVDEQEGQMRLPPADDCGLARQ